MAPALTDTPADTHRIRLKLAPSSSAINPSAVEENGATDRVLVPTNGAVKRKTSSDKEDHLSCAAGTFSKDDSGRDLGKIQQLVTSYRCSDETLKLQNVFDILPGILQRKHHTLELSEEQLKSIMSAGNGSGLPSLQQSVGVNVNGVARKFTKASRDSNSVTMNGGKHGQPALPLTHGGSTGNGPVRDSAEQHQCPRGVPRDRPNNIPESPALFCAPSQERNGSDGLATICAEVSVAPPPALHPLGSLGGDLHSRSQQAKSRQVEIEGRLRRLRKRLQVVQAKQVERHVQQQLGGLLCSTLGTRDSRVYQERAEPGRFLRGGSVPAELERLSLSCSTNLRAAENAFDSDATESSSGGETDVEEDELARADIEQRHMSLWRRAEGRYALERSSIISHWNWLQAHVSDLEYRIRQHTDIYRHIRTSKGAVVLGERSVCETATESSSSGSRTESLSYPSAPDADGANGSVSGLGVSMETNLRKSFPSVRHVNGVINSLRCGPSTTCESEQQRLSVEDSSCVAARTRPLISCRRRRLIRPYTLPHLNNKVQTGQWCGCDVSGQCVMCCSRPATSSQTLFQRPLLDRLAQLDPCVHPVLSFNDDVGMGLHLQRVMKCHWQGRPLDKIKPIKKLSLKHSKFSPSGRLIDPSSSASSCSKDKLKLTSPLLSTDRLSHHRMRPEKLFRHQQSDTESRQLYRAERSHTRKRVREHSVERDNVSMEVASPSSSLTTPTLSPVVRQLSTSESPTPCSLNTTPHQAQRKRRVESSFDINNIVIPMSVAATTRVEKLQYKEILTPSWRVVNIMTSHISEEDDAEEIEDLSDAAFSQLHLPYEDQERSRWSWTSSSVAKRRGSRSYKSVDGRSTPLLGGTTPSTPQPSSPDPSHFPLLQDYSSALSPSPSSPASPELLTLSHTHTHTPASRDSHRLLSNEDTRCSTPDTSYDETPVQPWEHRTFPLDTDPAQDHEHPASPGIERTCRTARRISGCRSGSRSECEGEPPSPLPEDTSRHRSNSLRHTHC
ncbi:hypothetical protein KOW79_010839 [Hemibagrus wyckioides]|uniref:PEHE domain-containing protein n=2 Tax=Hemibagrus wyckioides TaxID=337641 RepID=A0A9D3NP28_9TELE|nr:hypothetical protein KOW79_010839 [Hemibagrus wyckioides]